MKCYEGCKLECGYKLCEEWERKEHKLFYCDATMDYEEECPLLTDEKYIPKHEMNEQ